MVPAARGREGKGQRNEGKPHLTVSGLWSRGFTDAVQQGRLFHQDRDLCSTITALYTSCYQEARVYHTWDPSWGTADHTSHCLPSRNPSHWRLYMVSSAELPPVKMITPIGLKTASAFNEALDKGIHFLRALIQILLNPSHQIND